MKENCAYDLLETDDDNERRMLRSRLSIYQNIFTSDWRCMPWSWTVTDG